MGDSQGNPLRPRWGRKPRSAISSSDLRKYGLQRIQRPEDQPRFGRRGVIGLLGHSLILLWNGPWLILICLGRMKRRS